MLKIEIARTIYSGGQSNRRLRLLTREQSKTRSSDLEIDTTRGSMVLILNTLEKIIKRVHDRDGPVLVIKYHATWCAPCKESAPWFDALIKKFPGVEFASVDIDDVEAALEVYSVKTIPAIHVWYRGGIAGSFAGRESFSGIEPLLVHLRDHDPRRAYANQCSLEVAHVNSSDSKTQPQLDPRCDAVASPGKQSETGIAPENAPRHNARPDTTPINQGFDDHDDKTLPAIVPAARSKSEKRRP